MRYTKPIVWLIFILSGASGLIYEVIWMRQLTLIFGSTVFATSTVLTAFMAGLALGSYYFGRKIDESSQPPLRVYALLEAGIGAFCLVWPLIFSVLGAIYVLIHRHVTSEFYTLSLIRFVLTFGVLLIPSTLMGGTLPVLTRFFVQKREHLGTNIGILYALNTFGAVVGTVAAGFFLIEAYGIIRTLGIGIAINFGVAAVAFALTRKVPVAETDTPDTETQPPDSDTAPAPPERRAVFWAIGISGFCALGYEVLWTRILVFFLGSTSYAFATMLSAFLFGIALGSLVFSRWVDRIKQALSVFGIVQLCIGVFALVLMPAFEALYGMSQAFQSTFGPSRFWAFFACFLVMCLPTFLMGASFPLVTKIYTGSTRHLGRSIGNIYAVNTVGSILGAFCAGFLLIPLLGIRPSIVLMVLLNTGIGCFLVFKGRARTETGTSLLQGIGVGVPIFTVGMAAILLLTVNQPLFLKSTIFKTQRPGDTLIDYTEEVDATVTTLKDDEGVYRLYVDTNQAADASRWDSPSHRVIAHLPLLLHPRPQRALVVGFGMGLTSHSITQHGVHVDAIEVSSGVIAAAQKHFTHVNGNVFESPQFQSSINDGRNHILMTRTKYDMISTGIIHPLVSAGSSNIYTADFYRLCRRILSEDGIMCQWVPLHRLPETHYKMIVRTFIEVFPQTTLWYKYTPDFVILIGTPQPLRIDYKNFMARAEIASIREGLAADNLDGTSLLDSFMMGPEAVRRYVGVGPIHTDDRPRLEFFRGTELVGTTAQNIKGMSDYRERVLPYLDNTGATLSEKRVVREKLDTYFRATQRLIRGQIAYARGQYQSAASLMTDAVERNPLDETLRYNFGVIAGIIREGEQEELQRIEKQVQQALAQDPDDVQGHLHLATLYEMQGELGKATRELEALLRRDPKRAEVYFLLGPLYERQERYKDALRTYERLERLETTSQLPAPIFAAMAALHLHLENVAEAERYAKKGIAADVNSWRSYYSLGNVYAALNQPQKQREAYGTALKVLDDIVRETTEDQSVLLHAKEQIQNELSQMKE